MSCRGKVYAGQIGVLIEVDTQAAGCDPVDWSDATLLELVVQHPDGETEAAFSATLDGSLLRFVTTLETDLPIAGTYLLQSHIVGPTYDALGETARFIVYEKWK
jgi:hypothetical protein